MPVLNTHNEEVYENFAMEGEWRSWSVAAGMCA